MKTIESFGYIYITTNKINGKIYIGQCSSTPESTEWYLGSGTLIVRAIAKYGKENFSKKTLCRCGTQLVLDLFEEHFITKFKACNPEIGYNILPGSSNGFICGSPMLLPEVAARVSVSLLELYQTERGKKLAQEISNRQIQFYQTERGEEIRKQYSESGKLLIKEKNPNYANYWTEEQKQIERERKVGKYIKEDNPNWDNRWSEEKKKQQSEKFLLEETNKGSNNGNFGNKWNKEQRNNLSEKTKERHKRKGHPMIGKIWINNEIENKLWLKEQQIPFNFKRGLIANHKTKIK